MAKQKKSAKFFENAEKAMLKNLLKHYLVLARRRTRNAFILSVGSVLFFWLHTKTTAGLSFVFTLFSLMFVVMAFVSLITAVVAWNKLTKTVKKLVEED